MTRAVPTLYRRPDRGLFGVAAGIAEHVGVPAKVIRAAFVLLCLAGGLGIALYGAYLIVLPSAPGATRRYPQWCEYAVTVVGVVIAVAVAAQSLPSGGLFVPALLACLGGALIWRQAGDVERDRLLTSFSGWDRVGRVRFAAGVALVVAGALYVLRSADVTALRDGLIAMVVTVIGVALITGPWWMRTVTALSEERTERIRSQERADIAAHLHDSVLQTLALIQRNASSPREVARLARGQERELRTMLYTSTATSGQFGERLRGAAAEVEDAYAITVDVVVVGDAPSGDGLAPVVAAAREALVNAAKHAGVSTVALYAEVEADEVAVYVKDRGKGFEMDSIADDRQGVRGSIIGRIERHGGVVRVHSAAGEGTEVEIRMPRS